MSTPLSRPLFRIRAAVLCIIIGLVVSGASVFPFETVMTWLSNQLATDGNLASESYEGFTHWVLKIREGLEHTNQHYPFLSYFNDWLAFAHIVIAFFFVPVLFDPVRYRGNLWAGLAACIGLVPVALICGNLRGIPFGWQIFDAMFGVLCIVPMGLLLYWTRKRDALEHPLSS